MNLYGLSHQTHQRLPTVKYPGEEGESIISSPNNWQASVDFEDTWLTIANDVISETMQSNCSRTVLRWLNEETCMHNNSINKTEQSPRDRSLEELDLDIKQSSYVITDAYSDITDPIECSIESRPGSSLLSENEFANNNNYCHDYSETIGDVRNSSTYFVSLPNSHSWSIVGKDGFRDYNRTVAPSPFTPMGCNSSSRSSVHSPIGSELSFYEDYHNKPRQVPIESGRKTPPPPYRPPMARSNPELSREVDYCDIFHHPGSGETLVVHNNSLQGDIPGRLTPPPPYECSTKMMMMGSVEKPPCAVTRVAANQCSPSSSRNDGTQEEMLATADRKPSPAVAAEWDVSMPTPPAEMEERSSGEGECFPVRSADADGLENKVFVPADPEEWNGDHISQWLRWTEKQFSIEPIDRTRMPLDGQTLCQFTAEDFRRVTQDKKAAEILITHLSHLRQASGHSPKSFQDSTANNEVIKDGRSPIKFLESIKEVFGKCLNEDTKSSLSANGGGQIQLWQFLLELLAHNENTSIIHWEGEDGEFRLVDPEEVARKWGEKKSKPNMNYDKLSRALRYYYDKGIMSKVGGKRYTYRFDFDGLLRACQPTGVSDTYFIQPDFVLEPCEYSPVRNFNFQSLLNKDTKKI